MREGSRKLYNEAIQRKIPILIGVVRGTQIDVWCPLCQGFHFHGAKVSKGNEHLRTRGSIQKWDYKDINSLPDEGEGFRTAHCSSESSILGGFGEYLVLNIESLKNEKGEIDFQN